MPSHRSISYFALIAMPCLLFAFIVSCDKDTGSDPEPDMIELVTARVGNQSILNPGNAVNAGDNVILSFNVSIDPASNSEIRLQDSGGADVEVNYSNEANNRIITLDPVSFLDEGETYNLSISPQLKGVEGEVFDGVQLSFVVSLASLEITELRYDGELFSASLRNLEVDFEPSFEVKFSIPVDLDALESRVKIDGDSDHSVVVEQLTESTYSITPIGRLDALERYVLEFPAGIGADNEKEFEAVDYEFYTRVDTVPVFPVIPDEELLTLVQSQTFKYFWDFGHPVSGLARERNTSGDLVTSGGSGFGLMAMIVAVERGFITREEALERWETILNFLENADRFHGAWSHWLNGETGKVIPFSERDDGGDLVETAFLVQGMITVRQYLDPAVPREKDLIDLINVLWEGVEWDWYRQGDKNVLYWHWSPNVGWQINLAIRGHNETQIVYTLAAASPDHSIPVEVYDEGYARSGDMQNGGTFYGHELPLGQDRGGPLFFTHYSYLGMDTRNLADAYADYWTQNVNHSLINREYCIANPKRYAGYSEDCWGLTASDGDSGYSAHSPNNDRGVITPTAAISSIPYTPEESMAAIRHFYYFLGDKLWGEYGFYDAFNPTEGWVANSFLAIDQGPIICMIENYRTGLLWDLYMSAPEVRQGLDKLGFDY